jgi:hypothetical protein
MLFAFTVTERRDQTIGALQRSDCRRLRQRLIFRGAMVISEPEETAVALMALQPLFLIQHRIRQQSQPATSTTGLSEALI